MTLSMPIYEDSFRFDLVLGLRRPNPQKPALAVADLVWRRVGSSPAVLRKIAYREISLNMVNPEAFDRCLVLYHSI